ncbi:hypothetical protein K438DRAFT_1640417, partial [Mycena galopus ATCC 62051]
IDDEDAPPRKRGKGGPKSDTRLHFHKPAAIISDGGQKRWEFRCKHCKTSYTFPRTLPRNSSFDDEPKQPKLGNLATHLNKHGDVPIPDDVQPGLTRGVSASSAKIMEGFLREGKLNPAVRRTRGGFLKVFAAWLLEDDLPFTTGETDGIRRLFEYMQLISCFVSPTCLPSPYTMSVTLDNVSANDVLIRTLSRLLMEKLDIQFAPDNSQIRCIAHVVNLVVQKLLAAFNEAADPDNDDYYVPNKDESFHYNVDDDPVQNALENEPIPVDDDNDNSEEARADHADAALFSELAGEFSDLTPLNKASHIILLISPA